MSALNGPKRFIGRQQELARLVDRLRTVGEDEPGLVLVSGEPGVGKTRLVLELFERARSDHWLVLFGRAYESEAVEAYLPFSEALRDYVRKTPAEELRAQLGEAASDVALVAREVRRRLPDLPASSLLSPGPQRFRRFENVSDFLFGLADSAASGLVLGLDDLQWADSATLLLLHHLVRRMAAMTSPVLVVGTYRSVGLTPGQPLQELLADLHRERLGETVSLKPFDSHTFWYLMFLNGLWGGHLPSSYVVPRRTFSRSQEIDLGGTRVQLIEFADGSTIGGETVDLTIAWLPEQRVLHASDLLLNQMHAFLCDGTSVEEWLVQLEQLRELVRELKPRVVAPGHGNPGDGSLIDAQVRYLKALRRLVMEHTDGGELPLTDDRRAELRGRSSPSFHAIGISWGSTSRSRSSRSSDRRRSCSLGLRCRWLRCLRFYREVAARFDASTRGPARWPGPWSTPTPSRRPKTGPPATPQPFRLRLRARCPLALGPLHTHQIKGWPS